MDQSCFLVPKTFVTLLLAFCVAHLSTPASAGIAAGANQLAEDSLSALVELGYRRQNAQDAIKKALKNLEEGRYSVSDLVRASLKCIA